jgi:hypothetical protein
MYNIKPTRLATHLIHVKRKSNAEKSPYTFDYLLLLEIDETRDYLDGEVYEAKLVVHYQVVASSPFRRKRPTRPSFVAHYLQSRDSAGGDVRLTGRLGAGAGLFVSPDSIKGMQIGTYLMNQVVKWAKQWPEADVFPIELLRNQALLDKGKNKTRRNDFYEQFKIEFDYDDMTKESGISKPMKAGQLDESRKWEENITEENLAEHLSGLHQQIDTLTNDLNDSEAAVRRLRNQLEQEKKPPVQSKKTPGIGRYLFWLTIGLVFFALYKGLNPA